MRTAEMLRMLPANHKAYLDGLKADIAKVNEMGHDDLVKEYKAVARGYIRCLVECGIIDNFKTAWCWFTLPEIKYEITQTINTNKIKLESIGSNEIVYVNGDRLRRTVYQNPETKAYYVKAYGDFHMVYRHSYYYSTSQH